MLFSDIVGQEIAKEQLRQMVKTDHLPHALLLLGPKGSGNLALAIALAQYLLCENRTGSDSCGYCSACVKAGKLIHPDIHFSFPVIGANARSDQFLASWRTAVLEHPYFDQNDWLQRIGAENQQGNIPKEECMQLLRKLSLKTFESPFKILIMWLPEFLGKEGNRLLKMIEEPPENTVIILVAENQELILNTILSRCQLVKVDPLTDEEVTVGLEQLLPGTGPKASAIARLAGGNLGEAIRLASEKGNNNAQWFLDWMRKCYKGNGLELVKWVDQIAEIGRENQKNFLRYALHFLREFLLVKTGIPSVVRLQEEELQTARNLTNVIEIDQLDEMIRLFTDCSYHIERNASPKILFLDASIQLHRLLKQGRAAALKHK